MELVGPGTGNRQRRRGGSILEVSLILPWYIFLFVGAYDWGFYSQALLTVEAAARTAALHASSSSTEAVNNDAACQYVLAEMKRSVNLTGVSTCGSLPLIVTTTSEPGPDSRTAAHVSVTYRTQKLFPIPGLLAGQITLTRNVYMRLRG